VKSQLAGIPNMRAFSNVPLVTAKHTGGFTGHLYKTSRDTVVKTTNYSQI